MSHHDKNATGAECARDGCTNRIEAPYVPGGGERDAKLQALFERMAATSIFCPTCTANAQAYEREKVTRERISKLALAGLVPSDIRDRRLEISNRQFEKNAPEVWRRIRAKHPLDVLQRSLAIEGPPGVGKTFAASCFINAQLDKGLRAYSIQTSTAVGWKDSRPLQSAHWLHLDDFDKVEWTQKYCLKLFHLLAGIYENNGRVVLCLNDSLEDVYESMRLSYRGKWQTVRATFDRLHPCQREPMAGENLRKVVNA